MTKSTSFAQVANNLLNLLQGYTKSIRLLLVMFLTLTASTAWGADVTVKWTASSGALGYNIGSGTIKTGTFSWNYTRTLKSGSTYTGWISNCIQLGKNGGVENITFTTSAIPGTIKSVSVECSSYNNAHKVSIKVGNNTYLSSTATAKWTTISTKTGSGTSSGQIVISFTDGSRALYIKSISVTYEEAATCTKNPTISEGSHSNITSTTATVSCSGITSLGSAGCSIADYGFVYGTSSNPTISNTKVQVGTSYTKTGTPFDKSITRLSANTTYYVRPYATNGYGTAYGTQTTFKTLELPKYTVSFNTGTGNPTQADIAETTGGAGITLPAGPTPTCTDWDFAGWAEESVSTETTTKPTLFAANSNYKPTSNITLYAVYQRTDTTEGTQTVTTTTDKLTRATTGITGTNYSSWSGKEVTSSAVYAGQSAGGNESIQLRSNNSNSGVITTASGGKATKVVVSWNSNTSNGRTLDIYGKNSAYSEATDLYSTSTQGTKLGSIVYGTSTELTITGDYEYIGLRSNSGAMYLTSISIEWATTSGGGTTTTTYYHSTPECTPPCATVTIENATSIGGFSLSINTEAVTSPVENCGPVNLTITIVPYDGYQIQEVSNALSVNIDDHGTATVTYDKNSTIDSKVTLVPRSYDVVLHTNEGTINAGNVTSYEYGVGATLPTNVTKNGYVFGGWYEEETFYGTKVTTISTTETGNKEYWAKWDPAVYSITYNTNGGSAIDETSGTTLPDPLPLTTKIGYTFAGWYTDEGCTQVATAGAAITQNTTLYAKWTAKTYTITLDANGGTFVDNRDSQTKGSATFDYIYGTYANYNDAPNLTEYYSDLKRDGYQFDKWVSAGSPWNKLFTSTGDRTIQAQWSKLHTITFSTGTNNPTIDSMEGTSETGITLPIGPTPTCTDWTFAGWWTGSVAETTTSPGELLTAGSNYKPASDCTLYAVYSYTEAGGGGSEVIFNFGYTDWGKAASFSGTDYSTVEQNKNGVSVTYTRNEGSLYANTTSLRLYKTNTLTFDAGSNTITSIAFTGNIGQSDITTNAGTCTNSTNTLSWAGSSKSVTFTRPSNASSYATLTSATLTIGGGSTTTYNSNPTCLEPVWETNAATIDKTALTVNCGERSPMTGANGAAIISFPTEDIYNFTKDITIEATTGFLVSTSQSVDANYQSSVSLSPLVGTTNANTFYNKHVYVRAEAPAQSNTDLEGTITIKNNKGETLQTFSVTADVTCTTYTLTLDDRGTKTTAEYYAGASVPKPEDPTGVCTDPIHYVFDGWAEATVANGSTEYTKVTFPYSMPGQNKTLYAVYKIQSEGNANAFKLSYEVSGTTYYVKSINSDPYIKGFSDITADDAVTFYKEKIENNTEKYWVYFEKYDSYHDETTKEYLYVYDNKEINTTNDPSETQGWIITKLADGTYEFQSIGYSTKYLSFTDSGNSTDHTVDTRKTFNLLPAVSSTYYAIPDCDKEIKITFETGNGVFVANPDENPLVVTPGKTITLPICDYPGDGIEFIGWLKNTQQEELSDLIAEEYYYEGGEEYLVEDTRDVIFYAYYKVTPEEVEFTGQDDAELKIYHYNGVDNYRYANTFVDEHAELAGIERCYDATTWKFTNVGNMQYYIQDETGKYLGAVSDSDNDFSLSNTPKIWNFTLIDGLWRMICEDSPSRALMYISTGKTFANAALTNISNGAYSYVTLGICPDDGYTTNPVLSQGFSITNTAMVTSASGQKVKATSALTLETRNIELPCTFTISAPNITFYDNTGAEVTQLTSSAASEQFELHFAYKPTAENMMEYPTITITDDEMKTYTIKNRISARSLPNTFAIVAKVGNIWYALPSQGLNSTTPPAAYPVEVDNMADPTAVTAVPENADWSLRGVYEASRSDATKDRYVANGDNLVFVNNASPAMALNASTSGNYLLTDAQYANYYQTNPGLYEWTPTTTDLETYQLTNEQRSRTLSVNTATVFGVHATDKAVEQVRFLPIQNRYTPAALQVVEWKENSVVIMYNGNPAQTASVSVNGGEAQETDLSAKQSQRDIAVYELAADGLATNPAQRLSITIGTKKVILPIPYIISGSKNDIDVLSGTTVAARQEVAKVADLVVLKDAKLTAAGAKGNPYKFRNVTIYGGGKLVIPSEKGFGVASLTLRAGGITDAGEYDYVYDYVYPQFELRGTFTNSAAKINYDYITDYDHWFHLVLPFDGDLGTIKYPTEFYGANVTADNKGSWQIKRYAGEIRATGNYKAWVDIETDNPKPTATTPGVGYIFWGAPKKVSVNGGTKERQKWGIQRITMSVTADNAIDAENDKEGGKTISNLSSYENVANNSGKDNDQGWNLIGNPYMVNLTDMATTGLHACKLVEVIDPATGKWNGKWEWNNETNIRYLTIPSEHFDTYGAKTVSEAISANALVPGRAFFVQLEGAADGITFATANRASLMPALLAENSDKPVDIETGIILSNETLQDEVNFWIKDGKTNNYEYNADYPKTPNNNHFNIYGVHTNGDLSWVATSPEYAAQSMPIGYQVPAAGTFTLSLSETYYSENLQALFVTDHEASPEVTTNLVDEDYTFYVNQAETNNTRFTVSIILKPDKENTPTGVDNIDTKGKQPIKFIYQDKIYILRNGMIYDTTGKQVITINK